MKTPPPALQGVHPPNHSPAYRSTSLRAPHAAPIALPPGQAEARGPSFGAECLRPGDADLTRQVAGGEAQGQRILVHGRVTDDAGRPERHALVEVWQANAAGRYRHAHDHHDAPIDPYFIGAGQVVTDAEGYYQFLTIEPGAYPWGNHHNAWRPRHIHFSLFGPSWASRLVTQMYFEGDPLLPLDPIYLSVPETARSRLVAPLDLSATRPGEALAWRFDLVLRGARGTPFE